MSAAPPCSGAKHAGIATDGRFQVFDGTVFFGIQNDREWSTFFDVVVRTTDLAQDDRLVVNASRGDHWPALHEANNRVHGVLTAADVLDRLDRAGANSPLRTMAEFGIRADAPEPAEGAPHPARVVQI